MRNEKGMKKLSIMLPEQLKFFIKSIGTNQDNTRT